MDLNDTQVMILVVLGVALMMTVVILPVVLGVSIWYSLVPMGVVAAALRISNYRRRRSSASE